MQVKTRRGGYHFYFRSSDHHATAKAIKAVPGVLRSCGADVMCGKSHVVAAYSTVDGKAYTPLQRPDANWLGYRFGAVPRLAPQLADVPLVQRLLAPRPSHHQAPLRPPPVLVVSARSLVGRVCVCVRFQRLSC